MKKHIYFYKSEDEIIPFELNPEDGEKWNRFCQGMAVNNPHDPHPSKSDYLEFRKSLNNSENKIS